MCSGAASELPAGAPAGTGAGAETEVHQRAAPGAQAGLLADAHAELHAGATWGVPAGCPAGPQAGLGATPAKNLPGKFLFWDVIFSLVDETKWDLRNKFWIWNIISYLFSTINLFVSVKLRIA